jgi:hypothetical protein
MKRVFLIIGLFICLTVQSQTTVTNYLGAVSVNTSVGTVNWTCVAPTVAELNKIDGIYTRAATTGTTVPSDYQVRLVLGGTISGNALTGGTLTNGFVTRNFGSSSSLSVWGLSLAYSDINLSSFGCVYSAQAINKTYYLEAQTFGFSIPAGATINGVVVNITREYAGICSFIGSVKVNTNNGEKKIKSIKIGDTVLSYDTSFHKLVYKNVYEVTRHENDSLLKIKTQYGVVKSTLPHVFYSNKGLIEAEKLSMMDSLFINLNGTLKLIPILKIKCGKSHRKVYDISVEDNHSFFANSILVHNAGGNDYPAVDAISMSVTYTAGSTVAVSKINGVAQSSISKINTITQSTGVSKVNGVIDH